jgi:hypothetical protein
VTGRQFEDFSAGADVVRTVVELDGRLGYQYRLVEAE